MGLSKLRPVGSRVPLPKTGSNALAAPWTEHYDLTFVNSGTAALSLAVKLAVERRNPPQTPEVILPAYGCPDLVAAVVAQGARPVLVDLIEDRPWMDLDAIKNALSVNTVAIIAVGFLGIPERLTALRPIADEAGVALIEDSAQVFPPVSSTNGLAEYLVLSFGRGKPINLMGGGALLIRRDLAAESASVVAELPESDSAAGAAWHLRRWLFNLLLTRPLYGVLERLPFLSIGRTVYHPLKVINREAPVDGLLEAGVAGFSNRKDHGAVYAKALAELGGKGWVLLPGVCFADLSHSGFTSSSHILLRYSLLAPSCQIRDKALVELNRSGIGASAFYGLALPEIEGIDDTGLLATPNMDFPHASAFAKRLITLPTHEDVRLEDIESVSAVLVSLDQDS